ncbi:MAG: hypothetical protein IJ899_20320 [Blautia sp.]|nr:hypothetical protein [Blautia sp.]
MVKLNLNDGTNNRNMEGKAVIAIVIDPAGHDADCTTLMLGETSAYNTALAAGTGIGSIINQLGRNTFDRVMLASKIMDQIKGAIDGSGIKKKDITDVAEEKIFEGKMEDYKA